MSRKNLILTIATALTAMSLFFSPSTTHANPCSGYRCNNTRVKRLYLRPDGNVYVQPTDGGQANLTCGSNNNNSTYLVLEGSHKLFKEIYKTLLASQLAGKAVNFRLPKSSTTCSIVYITVDQS